MVGDVVWQADELESAKAKAISTLAHDVKNPLAAIRLRAQVLARRIDEGQITKEQMLEGLRRIEDSTREACGVLSRALDNSRVVLGRPLDLAKVEVDLAQIAGSVAARYQSQTEQHHLAVDVRSPATGMWDPNRLERLVCELIDNAVKFSPSGGQIVIEIDAIEDEAGATATLTIKDPGIGIDEQERGRIFDRFFTGSGPHANRSGAGLGLAAAEQIAAQHGGCITVVSQLGEGSAFTAWLPMERKTA